jgi:hypothetical protein
MAATYPSGEPDRSDTDYERPTLSVTPTTRPRGSPWLGEASATRAKQATFSRRTRYLLLRIIRMPTLQHG